jgi:broad specificity phosphatase PhoE
MNYQDNRCFLVRHGETEWSLARRHTGRTDLPLLPEGAVQAESLEDRLGGHEFALVLTSPLLRARETSRLAGWGDRAEVDPDLAEWDYGDYEGMTTAEILAEDPDWDLFAHGATGGETPLDVGRRADRVIARIRATDGDVLCFAHGHLLRVLGARWLGLTPSEGRSFTLDPASISILGWERSHPVVMRWNLS